MALDILLHDIEKSLLDIQSDKVTVRTKALESLQHIFDNRSQEVIKVLASKQDVSWRGVYMNLHDAVNAQAARLDDSRCTTATKNRSSDYSNTLMKCINLANSQTQNIAYDVILETAIQSFADVSMRNHFDLCYVQIIRKHILNSRHNLATVKIHQWSRLLSYLFDLYERSEMPKLNLLECFPLLIKCGIKYTHLAPDLHQYLPNVVKMVHQKHEIKAQHQVVMTVYEFLENLAANHRISICKFTEDILGEMMKLHSYRMDDATKLVLFKILHLSIVVHYPTARTAGMHTFDIDTVRSVPAINFVHDIRVWHKQLRNMHTIVDSEIKERSKHFGRSQTEPDFCNTFVSMAAALCAVIFWDDNVWVLPSDPPQTKRRCGLRKLDRLSELIERGDYTWQWAKILSKLISDYPNLIQVDYYQTLMQTISDLQPKIKYSIQGKVFNDLVRIMMIEEIGLKAKSTDISDQWYKIMQMALKNCATSNETAEQNVQLLQIMIENGYIVSYAFIETIMKEIATNTIKKSTSSVRLMIAIFQNVNMDLLTSGDDIKASVINWLSPKIAASELKRIIGNEEDIDIALVAELYVLCVLSKTDESLKLSFEQSESMKMDENNFDAIIENLKRQFSYQLFDKLMAVDCSRKVDHLTASKIISVLPEAKSVDVVLNENLYSDLERSLNPDDNLQPSANTIDDFTIIASSLSTYINILNQLLAYNAFDKTRYEKSFLYKRIAIKIVQLNTLMDRLMGCDEKDKFDVVEKLNSIWKFGLHPLVEQLVFEQDCNSRMIEWLAQQMQPQLRSCTQPLNRITFADLPFARKMQFKCLVLLTKFSTLDDGNGTKAFRVLDDLDIDTKCNENLFIMFELVRIILSRQSPEKLIQWAFEFLKMVCIELVDYHQFMEQVIENISVVGKSVRMPESIQVDQIVILGGFISQCRKKKFSPHLTVQLISTLKYVARGFALDKSFLAMFATLKYFLKLDNIRIQFETVECLAYIFNQKWISGQATADDGLSLTGILGELYGDLCGNLPEISLEDDIDKKSGKLAVRVQFHCSIVANCFCLRNENWFRLFELCCVKMQIRKDLILKIVTQICADVLLTTHADALKKTIPFLIAKWIGNNYTISLFPWYFTRSSSSNDFLLDENETIAIAVLRNAPNLLPEYVQMMQAESLQSILRHHETIVINCLAYITPVKVVGRDNPLNSEYQTSATKMADILKQSLPDYARYFQTHSLDIVEHLLANTWDETHFESLFGTRINYIAENHAIKHKNFGDSLIYIQNKSGNPLNIFQHYFSTEPHRLVKFLYALKLQIQETTFLEEKMLLLFHFCILADPISDIIRSVAMDGRHHDHNVEFFVRDFLHFFGNLINTSDDLPELKLATCKYFLRFCKHILPAVAEYFKPYLNFVVSVLVPIIKKNDHEQLAACSMDLLKFLIGDQVDRLRDAIAVLDRFPSQSIFNALRQVQDRIKYGEKEFSLVEEIDHFLSVEKRKIEGLIALKEHLSTKKNELQQMVQSIYDVHGFSEDCENSIIHRLINSLLLIVQGVDLDKAMMAARCLGELGPIDLGTTVLKLDIDSKIYRMCADFDEATAALYKISLVMLNNLLLHTDARVLQAVANACAHLLQTNIGRSDAEEKSHLDVFKIRGPVRSLLAKPNFAIELLPLFETDENFTHAVWIKKFTILILQQFGDEHLSAVASLQALFADAVLPPLIKILLSIKSAQCNDELGATVRMFFEKHFRSCDTNLATGSDQIYCNKMAIKSMLNAAECIRVHNLNFQDSKIHLNYLHIAKAANFCDAHFTAILYGEMARMKIADGVETEYDDNKIKMVMKESYQSIGEIDAVAAFIDPIICRSEYLQLKKSWIELYLRQDAISLMQPKNTSVYAQRMCESGLYGLANVLMQKANEVNYECAWRLGDWSVVERMSESEQRKNNVVDEYEKYHYLALKCLNGKDESGVQVNVEKARYQIIRTIKLSSFECTRNIYRKLTSLHLLQQIEEFCDVQFNVNDASAEMVIKKWKSQDAIAPSDFVYREPILAQRVRLFVAAGVRAKRKIQSIYKSEESIPAMVLQLVSECREEGHFTFAIRHLATIDAQRLTRDMAAKYHIEDARLNWALGNQPLAKHLIEFVCDKKVASLSYFTSQRIHGEYLAETRSEETKKVISDYLQNSIKRLKVMKTNLAEWKDITVEDFQVFYAEHVLETYQLIAKYADREYQQIAEYKKSSAYEKKNSNISNNKGRLAEMVKRSREGQALSKEEQSAQIVLHKTIKIDENDIKATEMDYDYYLEYAMESYLNCIALESDTNTSNRSHIFRVFALWLANKSNTIANDTIKKYIGSVASHKFIPLMPQITTHLSPNSDNFSKLIKRIVERCAIDHPYHTLHQIFALVYACHDIENSNCVKSPRTLAAEALIHKLEKQQNLCQVIIQMRKMCETLIRLANKTIRSETKKLPKEEALCKLKDLNLVHCPTVKLPISIDASYPSDRLITIVNWSSDLMLPGGINAPKRIKCICSNGQSYLQLLKGRDDLRQDAVMQQVFNMMNDMLSHSKKTKKLRLNVRTYIVVPLSQRSGILEWCENTIPLSEYLVGSHKKKGAHERYFPGDDRPSQCRERLASIGARKKNCELTAEQVLMEFKQICAKINPVLHYFFYEKFYSPGVWYERRLAYSHSLATTSMIGYILGIGDRHISNILIDEKTAELIHIDFGIAFEQGRCLPTPETIPFRLTRDLVSALGSTGIEGVFRKSCEETMEVLRTNKKTIVTIIEVLLHDPLYSWTLTNQKAQKRQHHRDNEVDEIQDINGMAERALLRLEEKLDGKHLSRNEANSIEGHVEILIQEATNMRNLSQLFAGWQAYL